MIDDTVQTTSSNDFSLSEPQESSITSDTQVLTPNIKPQTPPARGESTAADKYLKWLMTLISQDKLVVVKTDLNKFSLPALQTHYLVNLGEYDVEVSHSKHAETGKDFYVMLFNNVKKTLECPPQKIILAYINLNFDQFNSFKTVAEEHVEKKRKEAEEKRFREVLTPIDQYLENLNSGSSEAHIVPEETKPVETLALPEEQIVAEPVTSPITTSTMAEEEPKEESSSNSLPSFSNLPPFTPPATTSV